MHPNIFMCMNGHLLCKRCKLKVKCCPQCKHATFIRCLPMESVHKKINFPCKYSNESCSVSGNNIEEHEQQCKYNTARPCPLEFKTCDWKGSFAEMQAHIEKVHDTLFHKSFNNNILLFKLEGIKFYKNVYYFNFKDGTDLFKIILNYENGLLYIIVQFVGHCDEAKKYNYTLKIAETDNTKLLTINEKCDTIEYISTAHETKGFSISGKQLDRFSQSAKVSVAIERSDK